MFTINLEQELLKQNKKLNTPKELLLIKEYETYGININNNTLERLGLNSNLNKAKEIVEKNNNKKQQISNYNQERVFHISQVESICRKYSLRFLPIEYYKGTVPIELAYKIEQFEIAHQKSIDKSDCYIMAPAKNFKLEERPKDPLFFYKINEEYFYLIHKWGNDLSIFRRLISISSITIVKLICSIILLFTFFSCYYFPERVVDTILSGILACILTIVVSFMIADVTYTIDKDNWNSKYI